MPFIDILAGLNLSPGDSTGEHIGNIDCVVLTAQQE
jgi:hypothetical protein